ncbi:MAG TPA: hypothetical protein VNR39_06630 [Pseudolabrys sp.]|nr:hypothetical protein [Pseudolabrys sp.]
MDDRWSYPIPMTLQRHTGSAPKPRAVVSPPVAPAAAPETAPGGAEAAPTLQPSQAP